MCTLVLYSRRVKFSTSSTPISLTLNTLLLPGNHLEFLCCFFSIYHCTHTHESILLCLHQSCQIKSDTFCSCQITLKGCLSSLQEFFMSTFNRSSVTWSIPYSFLHFRACPLLFITSSLGGSPSISNLLISCWVWWSLPVQYLLKMSFPSCLAYLFSL